MDEELNRMTEIEEAKLLFEGLEDIKNNNLRDGEEVMKGLKDKYSLSSKR